MAWSDWFTSSNAQSYDDAQAHLEAQKQALAQKVADREAAGTLTPDQAAADYNTALQQTADDQNAAAAQGLEEGAMEGLNNVLNAPGQIVGVTGQGLGQVLGGILKNIPWWAYAIALVAGFFYLGGAELIRAWVSRKARM